MKALIIVDIQNDFLDGGALAVPNGNEIIKKINQLQEEFDVIVATQDWHPSNHKSFASQHEEKKQFEVIQWMGQEQTLWPDHCVQGTFGAELHKELDVKKIDAIIRKGTNQNIDSYSGFFDNQRIVSTGLDGYLKEKKVKSVYVCGLASDYCVYYTAIDALSLGYTTYLLEEFTKPIDPARFENLKEEFENLGGQILRTI